MNNTLSETYRLLSEKFPDEEVKQRPGGGGKMLSYIDARSVMNRLDDVVGWDSWHTVDTKMGDTYYCRLTIDVPTDTGTKEVTKTGASGATDIEGEKGGASTAFKRAAVMFGVGRYLYEEAPAKPKLQSPTAASSPAAGGDFGQMVEVCLQNPGVFKVNELTFVKDQKARLDQYGDGTRVSAKQKEWLAALAEKAGFVEGQKEQTLSQLEPDPFEVTGHLDDEVPY